MGEEKGYKKREWSTGEKSVRRGNGLLSMSMHIRLEREWSTLSKIRAEYAFSLSLSLSLSLCVCVCA